MSGPQGNPTEDDLTMEQGLDLMMQTIEKMAEQLAQATTSLARQAELIDRLSTRVVALETAFVRHGHG